MIKVNITLWELYPTLTISMILLKSIKVKNKGSKISKTRAREGWGKEKNLSAEKNLGEAPRQLLRQI